MVASGYVCCGFERDRMWAVGRKSRNLSEQMENNYLLYETENKGFRVNRGISLFFQMLTLEIPKRPIVRGEGPLRF